MRLSESAQEVLEQLWIAGEEEPQSRLDLDDVPSGTIDDLVDLGLVERQNGTLGLTKRGQPEAAQAVRRHRLAERLLTDVLATEGDLMDEHACRFEHVLVDGLDESICTLLGHPRFCPHGKPIPPGECCKQLQASVESVIAPLTRLQSGQRGTIAYIQLTDPARFRKLMAMGVLPGVPIKLMRRFPSYVFEAGYSQFAVDKEIADEIYVRLSQ